MEYNDNYKRGRMVKIQNKSTKRIRVAQIVLFMLHLLLTTCPFQYIYIDGVYQSWTVLDMIMFVQEKSVDSTVTYAPKIVGIVSMLFFIIPLVALIFQLFDRFYNIKNIAGLICSFVGVMLILYGLDLASIDWGAIFALFLYVMTFFLSVMGIFARMLNVKNTADEAPV